MKCSQAQEIPPKTEGLAGLYTPPGLMSTEPSKRPRTHRGSATLVTGTTGESMQAPASIIGVTGAAATSLFQGEVTNSRGVNGNLRVGNPG